jgi:hypothetical protein
VANTNHSTCKCNGFNTGHKNRIYERCELFFLRTKFGDKSPKISRVPFNSYIESVFTRDFPFGIAWNHSRLRTLPIVTAYAPPILARRNFFHFFYFWSQFLGFYLSNTRFSGSLARLSACCARIFPLVAVGVGLRRVGMYQPPLTVGGGNASRSMRSRIAANNFRVTATSAS